MRAIELFRLRRVRDKPRALAVIVGEAGLSPARALEVLHAAVGGGRPRLALVDDAAARACIAALAAAGFVARFAAGPDFDAEQRAQAALLSVQHGLPVAVGAAVGGLLLQGDWELALEQCLQHLRMHAPADDPARALLARTAVEVGLVAGAPGRA